MRDRLEPAIAPRDVPEELVRERDRDVREVLGRVEFWSLASCALEPVKSMISSSPCLVAVHTTWYGSERRVAWLRAEP